MGKTTVARFHADKVTRELESETVINLDGIVAARRCTSSRLQPAINVFISATSSGSWADDYGGKSSTGDCAVNHFEVRLSFFTNLWRLTWNNMCNEAFPLKKKKQSVHGQIFDRELTENEVHGSVGTELAFDEYDLWNVTITFFVNWEDVLRHSLGLSRKLLNFWEEAS